MLHLPEMGAFEEQQVGGLGDKSGYLWDIELEKEMGVSPAIENSGNLRGE